MSLFQDADSNQKNEYLRIINQRWGQLHSAAKEWTDNIVKYLFAINTGGAIAVLTYIGAIQKSGAKVVGWGILFALIFFVLGVFLVGLLSARMFYVYDGLYAHWRNSTKLFLNNQIDWCRLTEDDEKRSSNHWIDYVLPWSAFFVWGVGVVLGLVSFWN